MDKKHCSGCYNDFYNHRTNIDGKQECWLLDDAKLEKRVLIHVDQMPPYKGIKPEYLPNCYKRQRYVAVKPEAIGKDGYWAR